MSPPKHLALQKLFFFITRAVLFSRFEVGIDFPPWPFMGTKAHASNWSSRWWETWETVDPKTEENTEKVLKDQNSGTHFGRHHYIVFVLCSANRQQWTKWYSQYHPLPNPLSICWGRWCWLVARILRNVI